MQAIIPSSGTSTKVFDTATNDESPIGFVCIRERLVDGKRLMTTEISNDFLKKLGIESCILRTRKNKKLTREIFIEYNG